MNMKELLPSFRNFVESEILPKNYDFLVPIETKGMLILEEIMAGLSRTRPEIVCLRAFDYIPAEELQGKKVAVIDDSVFTGRTINKYAGKLISYDRFRAVDRYAFILYDSEENQKHRKIEDIKFCSILSRSELNLLLEEICQFSLRDRPTNPDHIILHFDLSKQIPHEALFEISTMAGVTVEYKRNPDLRTWSIHYPEWSPRIDTTYSCNAGPNKARITTDRSGIWFRMSSQFFPTLAITPNFSIPDNLWEQYYNILSRPEHDEETEAKNKYESFTLALRSKQAKRFISEARDAGIPIEHIRLEISRLQRYYGKDLVRNLSNVFHKYLNDISAKVESGGKGKEFLDLPDDIHNLTKSIMEFLDYEYRRENSSVSDKYEWKSVGRDIGEISRELGCPEIYGAIGAEILNDYGYCVPMFDLRPQNGKKEVRRSYRLAETGTARLHSYER
jgi:orotate phosphoribosyltransferase